MSASHVGQSIGVIGTGTMGKGVVQVLAECSDVTSVCWKGTSVASVRVARGYLETIWAKQTSRTRITAADASAFLQKVEAVDDYAALAGCSFILEVVSEDINVKNNVFREMARVAREGTILASNTSSLSITAMAAVTGSPPNVIGLHFFNPAPTMKLVEVIVAAHTSREAVERTVQFSKSLGKNPVVVKEAPGFVVNRMLIPMLNEAVSILADGLASAEDIDKAMLLGANHPIGPLALSDLIGNDVTLAIMDAMHTDTGDSKFRAHPLLRKMVRANKLGRKTGGGFFEYR